MKGIILCGGSGTRLSPLTGTLPKQLIPIANIPTAEYILRSMIDSRIKDIAIVVGDEGGKVEEYFKSGEEFGCSIEYFKQEKPLGIANALLAAEEFIDENIVLILGDNYFDFPLIEYKEKFEENKYSALVLTKEVDNPQEFGVAVIENGKLAKIVEKPAVPISNTAVIGIYFFTPEVIAAVSAIKPSWRGEYEITDAIQYLIDEGLDICSAPARGMWIDIGRLNDLLLCNGYILGKLGKDNDIGEGTSIIESNIGKNVSIGRNCVIKNSSVNNSIIMDGCSIEGAQIWDSIIGGQSVIKGTCRVRGILAGKTILNMSTIET